MNKHIEMATELRRALPDAFIQADFDAVIAAFNKRIKELEAAHQWQPIETAPKDGTEFQAWCKGSQNVGWWEPKCRYDKHGCFGIWGRVDYDINDWDTSLTHVTPTHWMPLPEPPQEQSDES